MDANEAVKAMLEAAIQAAQESHAGASTPETRAAYARGVRAMAGLVHACAGVADTYAEKYKEHVFSGVMFEGYATALRHIVRSADDLIPPGYEP